MSLFISENPLASQVLGRTIDVKWLFPETLTEGDVQLLFVQDGYYYMKLGGLKETFTALLEEKPAEMNNVIMITVSPGSPSQRRDLYHPEGAHFEQFLHFFYDELLPDVERKLAAMNLQPVKMGGLGDSLAGVAALYLAITQPTRWTHLMLQSAAFDEGIIADVTHQLQQPSWHIYQVVGEHENHFKSPVTGEITHITDGNEAVRRLFLQQQLALDYHREDAEHVWVFWKEDLRRALHFFVQS
ncbi:putative esterase [Fictibacillus macauensis ZFHKF-1]|uniref:Putative esterase n=1 Tax=Fictibacillus macauensis ZFHKF-1 TaxID=1196324 RepID=I8IWR7_9BACL|nr:alpha/beta hydrolase-fold protein [Fictibacillus macauensis]EIT83936.1 putative esterase [Fictibacillus macauensis ZFHKF-1]